MCRWIIQYPNAFLAASLTLLLIGCSTTQHKTTNVLNTNLVYPALITDLELPAAQTTGSQSLQAIRQTGYFEGANGQQIYFEQYLTGDAQATIVLVHGLSESLIKYRELVYYFTQENYNVIALEHRGHGRSGSLGKDASQVHVQDWRYYVDDLEHLVLQYSPAETPILIFAHSMGGGIATALLERQPDLFAAAVLTAPMHQINVGGVPPWLARYLAAVQVALGREQAYAPAQEPYRYYPFEEMANTGAKNRHTLYQDELAQLTELQRGGISYGWLNQAKALTRYLQADANLTKVSTPVMIFQAELENMVDNVGHFIVNRKFANSEVTLVENAKHDLYRESDEILGPYLATIFDFYKASLLQ